MLQTSERELRQPPQQFDENDPWHEGVMGDNKLGVWMISGSLEIILGAFCATFVISRVYATLHPALSVGRSVGWSICRSVTLILFFVNFLSLSHFKSFKSIASHSKSS